MTARPYLPKSALDTSRLSPPSGPKFPLSSPITEETMTPIESFEHYALPATKYSNPFSSPEDRLVENVREEDSSADEEQDGPLASRQNGESKKKDRPDLNVVTDFSTARLTSKKEEPPAYAPAFVDLNDLKSLSQAREKEKSAAPKGLQRNKSLFKWKRNGPKNYVGLHDASEKRSMATEGFKNNPPSATNPTVQALQQSATKQNPYELSPSDRPIVIGITIPHDEVDSHSGSDSATPKVVGSAHTQTSQLTPMTPSIIVTPAEDNVPRSSPQDGLTIPEARPASSIYSQATPLIDFQNDEAIPPVPAIPDFHAHKGEMYTTEKPKGRRERAFSAGSVFEDDSPLIQPRRTRAFSNESMKSFMRRMSLDTLASQGRRSQGWWNLLLSPLATRSSTFSIKKGPPSNETPPVPPIRTSMLKTTDTFPEKEISCFSPETPMTSVTRKSGVTSWPDFGSWNGEAVPDLPRSAGEEKAATPQVPTLSATVPPLTTSLMANGSVLEYFQACIHDLTNPTPYFECVNHECSYGMPNAITGAMSNQLIEVDEKLDGTKGLLIEADTDQTPKSGSDTDVGHELLQENPNNPFFRFSETFVSEEGHSPKPRSRADSASTTFEEDHDPSPVDREVKPAPAASTGTRARVSETWQTNPVPRPVSGGPSAVDRDERREIQRLSSPHVPMAAPFVSMSPEQTPVSQPPAYSPPERTAQVPRYRAILPPQSPGPISPGMQQAMSTRGAIQMSDMDGPVHPTPAPITVNHYHTYENHAPWQTREPVTLDDIERPVAVRDNAEARRQRLEKEDKAGRKCGALWRGRGCLSDRGCFGRGGREGRNRRRWYIVITAVFLAIIIIAIALATTLTRKGDGTPVQSRWLNLTGYPPMPTGIMTIAGPSPAVEDTGCVFPSTMWSCAVPKDDQGANSPYPPDHPDFRLQISFRNGTYDNSTAVASNSTGKRSAVPELNAATAGQFFRAQLLRARDAFTDSLYTPSPAAPSTDDQIFMGNTTDNVTAPYNGEETPFFITFMSPTPALASRLVKRDDRSGNDSSSGFPDLTSIIPGPSTAADGTAAAATLYPLPESQPVRLYDRGLQTEHYGFYTYFDKSIFLKSAAPLNATDTGEVPADQDGGASKDAARVRCTWAQTRFLVRIWTQPVNVSHMAMDGGDASASSTTTASVSSPSATGSAQNASGSATDFVRPGSFPYPVTITLDRHGGDADKKMVYCYGVDARGRLVDDEKKLQQESRDFGGVLIDPAPGIFNLSASNAGSTGGTGGTAGKGIDGGTGGCSCEWRNWIHRS